METSTVFIERLLTEVDKGISANSDGTAKVEQSGRERQGWSLVLLSDENYGRGEWPLAIVEEVIPGRDEFVRTIPGETTSTAVT